MDTSVFADYPLSVPHYNLLIQDLEIDNGERHVLWSTGRYPSSDEKDIEKEECEPAGSRTL